MKLVKAATYVLLLLLATPYVLNMAQAFAMDTETEVCVHPAEIKVKVGQIFEVYINVCDVSWLQGFDFMLKYNTEVLDCLALEEGPFFSSFGDTFIAKEEINDEFTHEYGRVWFAMAILGKDYANGSGTLAVIRFKAIAVGESILDLYSDYPYKADEIKLVTCSPEPISHIAIDGYVIVDNSGDPPPNNPLNPRSADVNGDGFVDISDIDLVARAYGTADGDEHYDVKVDLDENESVDIRDLTICAQMFGKKV